MARVLLLALVKPLELVAVPTTIVAIAILLPEHIQVRVGPTAIAPYPRILEYP